MSNHESKPISRPPDSKTASVEEVAQWLTETKDLYNTDAAWAKEHGIEWQTAASDLVDRKQDEAEVAKKKKP